MNYPQHVYVTANSPGEVSGWLTPLLEAMRTHWPTCKVSVILLPCTFATGSEERVLREDLQVDEIIPASRYWRLLFTFPHPPQGSVLLHLGGDLMYSALLLAKWRIPAWSYLWARWWWDWAFKGYFAKNQWGLKWLKDHKISEDKTYLVGDLVFDDVACDLQRSLQKNSQLPEPDPHLVTFLPGSRLIELENLTPFFLKVAQIMRSQKEKLHFQVLISPFIDKDKLSQVLQNPPHKNFEGLTGHFDGQRVSAEGTSIKVITEDRLAHLRASAFCITIPGTKTAQAACLGVPQMMILPLNRPECLPYIGILGLLDWIPGGKILKGKILMRMKERVSFQALPNIMAERAIMPELIDVLTPQLVAQKALELLDNPQALYEQRKSFAQIYTSSEGTARRILRIIENNFN